MGKRKNKNSEKKKISLVFDESKRKDFLCGFRKRKLERKKKAKEQMERMLKEEKKRIKQENKESYKKLVVSSRPLPDIEQLLQEEYEDEDVNVKIVELSSDTLQKKDIVIGDNRPKESIKTSQTRKKKDEDEKDVQATTIPGMGSGEESNNEESEAENVNSDTDDAKLKTKKELKTMLKKQATKKIQKSKIFQMKSKLDKIQNKKKSQQKNGHTMKGKKDMKKNKSKKKFHRKK